jgi:alpha-L-rhamnosidase
MFLKKLTWRVTEGFLMGVSAVSTGMAVGPAPERLSLGEGFENPIGFYDARPTFSWQLPLPVTAQTAYQIVVASEGRRLPGSADLWDSGKVVSDQSVWMPYGGVTLQSRQRVTWQVRFWDEYGRPSGWSKPARFELGLLENEDWKGTWIRMGAGPSSRLEPPPEVFLVRAVYGVAGNPEQQIDLTEKVRERIAAGTFRLRAENDLAGGDPAYGVVKTLELDYTLDGEPARASVSEGEVFSFIPGDSVDEERHFTPEYLRREFGVADQIAHARLFVTARGLFEVHINGRRVGLDQMAPGWTPYHARIETLAYDVTDQLREGENAIGAILGEGWYAGELMRKTYVYPEARPLLLLQLEVTLADGSREIITTDELWKATHEGPIRYSSIYHGETYDASREMAGWTEPGFDDAAWWGVVSEELDEKVRLVPKRHHPVRATAELPAVAVNEVAPGRHVFDLGQNMVGRPRLTIPVEEGGRVTVRFAEMLEKDGTLYTANYRAAKSTIHYSAGQGGTIAWEPAFTFFGFRYVELSGLPEGAEPELGWVTGIVLHSDFPRSGRFTSSHAKLNQLQQNITWGLRGNFLDIPTDCPQRDERLGWTGDAQVFCPTSLFNYQVLSFWMSWLQSVREEQTPEGLIPHVVPDTGVGAGSPGWGDVGVTAPWDIFVRTGHRAVLEENYEMMRRWTEAYEREAEGFIVGRRGYGDWLQPYPKGQGSRGDTPMNVIATAYFGRCVGIMRSVARALDREEDAARYDELFTAIRKAFSETFFDSDGKLTGLETQTGYLMALGYDLLLPELRPGALEGLLTQLEAADGHLRTGFLGTPLLAVVLDRFGYTDSAYTALFKETYPSWFYSIDQGATTMWERWNSYSHEHGFGDAGMNSFNHYAYGAIGQWMYERVAGLAPDPDQPGYKHFFIQPNPGGPLTSARAELDTPYGRAGSGWEKTEKGLTVTAIVPPNTTATLVVPAAGSRDPTVTESGERRELRSRNGQLVYSMGPGEYEFTVE